MVRDRFSHDCQYLMQLGLSAVAMVTTCSQSSLFDVGRFHACNIGGTRFGCRRCFVVNVHQALRTS